MKNRNQLALGFVLILLGAWFVLQRQVPALDAWSQQYLTWPLNLVAIGAGIFLVGLLIGAPGMTVPAAVVAGIGGILYYQSRTEDYTSWSFMWALIPGFVGFGQALAGLLARNWHEARNGLNLIFTSAVLFVVFAALFGRLSMLGGYLPAFGLILLGCWFLLRGLWRSKKA